MSYQMYAYRPAIGVAVCKKGDQWLLVDLEDSQGDSKLISEKDSQDLAKHLSLINFPKVFPTFDRLMDFLREEYRSVLQRRQPLKLENAIEDDLEFLDREFILAWLHELEACLESNNFDRVDPRTVKENLEILARHPKFEADLEILRVLNPLRNAWERKFSIPIELRNNPTEREALDRVEMFPQLNGRSFAIKQGIPQHNFNLAG
jgi:hypothetical protein